MALIGPSCAISVMIRIDVEDDPCNVAPVSPLRIGSKHPDIGDGVLFVIRSERRPGRGNVGAIRIEQQALHRSLANERCTLVNHTRALRQPRGNNHGMPKITGATLEQNCLNRVRYSAPGMPPAPNPGRTTSPERLGGPEPPPRSGPF